MTNLIEDAVAVLRDLPAEIQRAAARAILALGADDGRDPLDSEA